METTELSSSDLCVSRVAFGGCPMGGHGWGAVSRAELETAVRAALDHGLNFFDTADTYGLGESEETLGAALRGRREEAVIATKFGVRVEGGRTFYDNSPSWIRTALEASLRRLGTDYIDLYQVHYRDGETPLDDLAETLLELRDEGKIRYLGLSNLSESDVDELKPVASAFVSFQNEFSLATRDHESEIVTLKREFGLTPLTWGSLGQGILSGKYDSTVTFGDDDRRSRAVYVNFHGDRLTRNLRVVDVLRELAVEYGKPVPAVAIRWILDHLPGSVAIVGVKNTKQLESNLDALGWHLSPESLEALDLVSSVQEQ